LHDNYFNKDSWWLVEKRGTFPKKKRREEMDNMKWYSDKQKQKMDNMKKHAIFHIGQVI
jgi:hypothetical protein